MNKVLVTILLVFVCVFCVGCIEEVSMPYSSEEYANLGWSANELVDHFDELGFVSVKKNITKTFEESEVGIKRVSVKDSDDGYRAFDKGEVIDTWSDISISAYELIPTITVDNNSDFATLVKMEKDSPERDELYDSFMKTHKGEYLKFDGVITDWYDEIYWIGVSFSVSVENSEQLSFSWSSIGYIELDQVYYTGGAEEGVKVNMILKISDSKEKNSFEIESMRIVE